MLSRKKSEVVFLIRFNFRGSAIGDRMIRYCDELISKIIKLQEVKSLLIFVFSTY